MAQMRLQAGMVTRNQKSTVVSDSEQKYETRTWKTYQTVTTVFVVLSTHDDLDFCFGAQNH